MSIRKPSRPLAVEQLEDRSLPSVTLGEPPGGLGTVVTTAAVRRFALGDGGFELPELGAGRGAYQYHPAYAGAHRWVFTGPSGVTANRTHLTARNPDAPAGDNAAFIQNRGGISQDRYLKDAVYSIKFRAAQRAGDRQTIRVLVDGNVVGTFTPGGIGYGVHRTLAFAVREGMHTIRFEGTGGGGATAFLDQISLQRAGLGFETPRVVLPGPLSRLYLRSPWTFSGNAGVTTDSFYLASRLPPEGQRAAYLNHGGGISREFVLAAGTYTVGFLASALFGRGLMVRVLVDGQEVGTFTPPGEAYAGYTTPEFTVTAGTHTIRFEGFDPDFPPEIAWFIEHKAEILDPGSYAWDYPFKGTYIDLVQINPAG